MADIQYKRGAQVEVKRYDDTGIHYGWYPATFRRFTGKRKIITVEYHTISTTARRKSRPLIEKVWVSLVRLRPPRDTKKLMIHQNVEAWYKNGWWAGIIIKVLENSRYVVSIQVAIEEIEFERSDLRDFVDWIDGIWVCNQLQRTPEMMFRIGEKIEVKRNEENFTNAWFPATIVSAVRNNGFLVEYESLKREENKLLRETIDIQYIRPSPPISAVKKFDLHKKVDALCDGGWWHGIISKILSDRKYLVYFIDQNEYKEFGHSNLRHHQVWFNNNWIQESQENVNVSPDLGRGSSVNLGNWQADHTAQMSEIPVLVNKSQDVRDESENIRPDSQGKALNPCNRGKEIEGTLYLVACQRSPMESATIKEDVDLGGTNSTNQENLLEANNTVHIAEVQPGSQGEACQVACSESSTGAEERRRKKLKGREGEGMVIRKQRTKRQRMRAMEINTTETKDLLTHVERSITRAENRCLIAGTSTGNNQHGEEEAGHQNETHQMPLSGDQVEPSNFVLIDLTDDELPSDNTGSPFVKSSHVWATIESMEAFHTRPQTPHFNPLREYCEELREGKAIGYMVIFANLVDKIHKLRLEDPRDIFVNKLNALEELEQHGFDVQQVQARLLDLIRIKDEQGQAEEKRSMVIGKILERKHEMERIDTEIEVLDGQIKLQAEKLAKMVQSQNRLQQKRALVHTEINKLRMEAQAEQREHHEAFTSLVTAPW